MVSLYTYYYGSMHRCHNRNREAGYEVDEWELLRRNPNAPKPLSGYYDDSAPETIRTEAALAKAYGIDGFIFNLYHNGTWSELSKPLEVFTAINHPPQLRFALNWCYRMPRRVLPVPLTYEMEQSNHMISNAAEKGKNINNKLSPAAITAIVKFAAGNYFNNDNYISIDNKAYFSIYHVAGLLKQYGLLQTNKIIAAFRREAKRYGTDLHMVGLLSVTPEDEEYTEDIRRLELDALSAYCSLADFKRQGYQQDYTQLSAERVKDWATCTAAYNKCFYPCIAAGWNASSRGAAGYDQSVHGLRFPWAPVVINDTPANFAAYLQQAVSFAERLPAGRQIALLGPWNEWSEGCYLLPDQHYGYGKLEAIKAIKLNL